MHEHRQGFTLIEIALVITIIALVVGGILLGRDVLRNSALQSVISDVDRFKKAAQMFKEKYYYLPGDLPSATTYWGTDGTCPTGVTSNYLPRVATCNGDGDGFIVGESGGVHTSPISVGASYHEAVRLWQHLANAGFIEGAYSGIASSGAAYTPGTNTPKAKTSDNHGYSFFYSSPVNSSFETPDGVAHTEVFPARYGHIIEFGSAYRRSVTGGLDNPAITTSEAKNIDEKIDDGEPASGNVMSFTRDSESTDCATEAAPFEYVVSTGGIACALIFITGF